MLTIFSDIKDLVKVVQQFQHGVKTGVKEFYDRRWWEGTKFTPTYGIKALTEDCVVTFSFDRKTNRAAVTSGFFLEYNHEISSGFRGRKGQKKGKLLV